MFVYQGKEIMQQVRDFFSKGHKSSNKRYYVDLNGKPEPDLDKRFNDVQMARINKRFANSIESKSYRTPAVSRLYDDALAILKVATSHRSGNCDEMSSLSAFYAYRDYNVPQDCLYVVTVSPPADHVFCVVTEQAVQDTDQLFASVTAFVNDDVAKMWVIIDPWLHVCCRVKDYLTKANEQLDKWGAAGKRIDWFGSLGDGWYAPNGEYKTDFAKGRVIFEEFFEYRRV